MIWSDCCKKSRNQRKSAPQPLSAVRKCSACGSAGPPGCNLRWFLSLVELGDLFDLVIRKSAPLNVYASIESSITRIIFIYGRSNVLPSWTDCDKVGIWFAAGAVCSLSLYVSVSSPLSETMYLYLSVFLLFLLLSLSHTFLYSRRSMGLLVEVRLY